MSNAIFPGALAGEGWSVVKRPLFSNVVAETASGNEVRIANYPYPRFQYELTFDALPSAAGLIAGVSADFQTLFGFYCARTGNFDSFLFDESDHVKSTVDSRVTSQIIGTGNGSNKDFQMQRTLGGSTRPVYDVNGVIANNPSTPPAINVYLAGVLQGSGYTISSTGLLHFTSAPGGGVQVTADFSYFWRCRFTDSSVDFDNFVQNLWAVKRLSFMQVRA